MCFAASAVALVGTVDCTSFSTFPGSTPADASAVEAATVWCNDAGLCDDFERDDPVDSDWLPFVGGGALAIDSTASRYTPSRSFRATVPSGTSDRFAYIAHRYTKLARVVCSFSIRVNAAGAGAPPVDLFVLQATPNDKPPLSYVRFGITDSHFAVRQDIYKDGDGGCDCGTGLAIAGDLNLDTWRSVKIDTDMTKADVSLDGKTQTFQFEPYTMVAGAIELGVYAFGASAAADVSFDDLACDAF
jgi:hypothetical protein